MLADTEAVADQSEMTAATNWLAQFETALAHADGAILAALFHSDSHWRDVLAFTWTLETVSGRDAIAPARVSHADFAAKGTAS